MKNKLMNHKHPPYKIKLQKNNLDILNLKDKTSDQTTIKYLFINNIIINYIILLFKFYYHIHSIKSKPTTHLYFLFGKYIIINPDNCQFNFCFNNSPFILFILFYLYLSKFL